MGSFNDIGFFDPSCGVRDVAVYRWILVENSGPHLRPVNNNLPLRNKE